MDAYLLPLCITACQVVMSMSKSNLESRNYINHPWLRRPHTSWDYEETAIDGYFYVFVWYNVHANIKWSRILSISSTTRLVHRQQKQKKMHEVSIRYILPEVELKPNYTHFSFVFFTTKSFCRVLIALLVASDDIFEILRFGLTHILEGSRKVPPHAQNVIHLLPGAGKLGQLCIYGCFLKRWYPTIMGFPTRNDHFGVFWGYHH